MFTWGYSKFGKLGHPNSLGVFDQDILLTRPTQIVSIQTKRILMAGVGDSFTSVLTREGTVLLFGELYPTRYNLRNQMDYISPLVCIPNLKNSRSPQFIKISTGGQHIAGIDSKGKLFTWGKKYF